MYNENTIEQGSKLTVYKPPPYDQKSY